MVAIYLDFSSFFVSAKGPDPVNEKIFSKIFPKEQIRLLPRGYRVYDQ
jgi:hypothetical protein